MKIKLSKKTQKNDPKSVSPVRKEYDNPVVHAVTGQRISGKELEEADKAGLINTRENLRIFNRLVNHKNKPTTLQGHNLYAAVCDGTVITRKYYVFLQNLLKSIRYFTKFRTPGLEYIFQTIRVAHSRGIVFTLNDLKELLDYYKKNFNKEIFDDPGFKFKPDQSWKYIEHYQYILHWQPRSARTDLTFSTQSFKPISRIQIIPLLNFSGIRVPDKFIVKPHLEGTHTRLVCAGHSILQHKTADSK
jgi:hypothetical protein